MSRRDRDEIDDMFDLAAPAVEDDLVARLIPEKTSHEHQQLLDESGIVPLPASGIELRGAAAAAASSSSSPNSSNNTIIVGRGNELKIPFRIDCGRLSNAHAKFKIEFQTFSDGSVVPRVCVIDTSTNGVWLNGQRLPKNEPHQLKDGDVVCLLKPQPGQIYFPFVFSQKQQQQQHHRDAISTSAFTVSGITDLLSSSNTNEKQKNDFISEITCSICMGTYTQPTCVMPCLHTFCGPCVRRFVAESLKRSATAAAIGGGGDKSGKVKVRCPDCRGAIAGHSVNHKVQSLIQQVTAANAEYKRDGDDIVELERAAVEAEEAAKKAGVVTFDLAAIDKARRKKQKKKEKKQGLFRDASDDDDDDEGGDDEFDDNDGDDDDELFGVGGGLDFLGAAAAGLRAFAAGAFAPLQFAFQATDRANKKSACGQCANADPVDGFRCPPGGNHLTCKFCTKVFPDRPLAAAAAAAAAVVAVAADNADLQQQQQRQLRGPQRCGCCSGAFCDAYCGPCAHPAGRNALQKMQDYNAVGSDPVRGSLPIAFLYKGNVIEQQILIQYLQDNNITPKEAWQTCLEKFKAGAWTLDITAGGGGIITANTPLCKMCAEKVFASLLVHYRIAVPRDQWPAAVGARADCWYGLECRTQHHNQAHAQKLNHVCIPRKGKE